MSRAATSRLKINPQLGSPPTLEFRALAELQVDETYQRSLETEPSSRLIRRIAQFWDWGLCQPLAVARRSDGTLMVVDGQHRLAAAKMRNDIAHLPCVITSYANSGDEAAAFVALNQNRKPLSPLDLFKAALVAEDATALAVQRIMAAAGLRLAPHTNWQYWKPGMLANVNALQAALRKNGELALHVTLSSIARGFDGVVLQYAGTIFSGLLPLVVNLTEAGRDPADLVAEIGAALSRADQRTWVSRVRTQYAEGMVKWNEAGRIVFHRAYERRLLPDEVQPNTPPTAWCSQCDQRVSTDKASRCASPFCSLKAKAA